jgi:two-component system chemotaxis response regulator CheY
MSRILIVDDAQFMRMRIAKLLTEYGHEVFEAADGEAAVQTYRFTQPDAVLMDITMPKMDGLSALAEILRFDPKAKVIMLSALGQQAMILQAIQTGAKDFLVKPHNPERVLNALHKVLG